MNQPNIMTIEQVRDALKDRRIGVVADACGLSYPTVKAIADGETGAKYETVKVLSDYLSGN